MNLISKFSFLLLFGATFGQTVPSDTDENCFVADIQSPNVNVTFWMYKSNKEAPVLLNQLNLSSYKFDKSLEDGRSLTVLIHGYTGHKDHTPNPLIRPKLLEERNMYVLSVDYGPLARQGCYLQAVQNLQVVGKCLAGVLDDLVEQGAFQPDRIHIIGFSLGAHTAGITSNYVQHPLKWITGLDPSKPFFTMLHPDQRLDITDAQFVDVFHTSVTERGMLDPVGHVDFYPNFGFVQPGCLTDPNFPEFNACSHNRAPVYYAESIDDKKQFLGVQTCLHWYQKLNAGSCKGLTPRLMGFHVSNSTRGVFFAKTAYSAPYALGMKGARNLTHFFKSRF